MQAHGFPTNPWIRYPITAKKNMRLSKSDIIAASTGILLLASLSYLLYADINRQIGAGSTELIGDIKSKRNVAERKYSAQVVWDEVEKNSKLYNFDTIRTADQSEAIIRLKDGTEIVLNENSMVLLSYTEKELDIKFMQGAINAKQAADKEPGSRKVNIISGDSKVALNNSDVSLSRDRDKKLQVTVNKGKATFLSGNEEKVLNENQNIVAGKDSIQLFDLTVRLTAPENNAYITTTANNARVHFAWERPRGDYTSHLEIANNLSLIDQFVKKRTDGNTLPQNLAEGTYYWRVTAVNNATKKIESSEIRKLAVVSNRPVELISPANKSTIKYWDVNPMINFIWSRNESIPRYTLAISGKPDMSSAMVNTVVEGNKISLNSLGMGTYYWKIINVPDVAQPAVASESAVYSFTISKTDKLSPPEPLSPADNKTLHPLMITQKGINFAWKKDSSIPETQIIIAEDRELSKVILKRTGADNFIKINDALKEGSYYWNLRGIMATGSTTESSKTMRFKVSRETGIRLVEPLNNSVLIYKKDKPADITFSWSKSDIDGTCRLEVSKDKKFTVLSKQASLSESSTVIPDIPEGSYFWRVKLTDEQGAELLSSPVYSFDLLGKLDTPLAMTPKAGSTVTITRNQMLDFQWNAVKGANLYRIGVFQVQKGIHRSIAAVETRKTSYQFTELRKLSEGNFLWSLQAVDTDAVSHRERRKSNETRMDFKILSGFGEKKINIKSPKILYLE
jgi:hypothetical protein